MSHPGSSPQQATTWRGLEHIYIMSVSLQIDTSQTWGRDAEPSGLPQVLGTFSLQDHPEAHASMGTGDGTGRPPPPPPAGPPPGIPSAFACIPQATEEDVIRLRPLLVQVCTSCLSLTSGPLYTLTTC